MKTNLKFSTLISVGLFLVSCKSESQSVDNKIKYADVTAVSISGDDNHYQFGVTVSSPDTGCEQYADWWEVVSESGELLYRRILAHSHVNEQPFSRSGGDVPILRNQKVWVRAHMNNVGYGGKTMIGTVDEGFVVEDMPADFAKELETQDPLPSGCNF